MDLVSYAVLPGKDDVVIFGSPSLAALGINVYNSLGECARKRDLSVQCVELPNFKECRQMSTVVKALLQRGPGAPEPSDEAFKRLVSRGPDIGYGARAGGTRVRRRLGQGGGDCGGKCFVGRG